MQLAQLVFPSLFVHMIPIASVPHPFVFLEQIIAQIIWTRTLNGRMRPELTFSQIAFTVLSEPLRSILKPILPASIFAVFDATCWGWEFHDKGAAHEKFGDAFIMVTTGHNRLVCADPAMSHSVLARRKDFLHPELTLKTMGMLGPNLVTVSRNPVRCRWLRVFSETRHSMHGEMRSSGRRTDKT